MTTATPIYRAIMLECDRRRTALGIGMEKFSEYAGLPDRYYSKALHADEASGRQAQWSTLQIIIDGLFPEGFDLIIKPKPGPLFSANNLKAKLLGLKATTDRISQREHMSKIGHAGRAQQLANQTPKHRSRIARKAAKARWRKPRITELKDASATPSQAKRSALSRD